MDSPADGCTDRFELEFKMMCFLKHGIHDESLSSCNWKNMTRKLLLNVYTEGVAS